MKSALLATLMTTVAAASLLAAPAQAEKIKFYSDPVFEGTNPAEPHPMSDLIGLAEGGDVRAQFILGDLYAKGKGGLKKDAVKAQKWFEASARNGYDASFIRLAALAKRAKKPIEAYSWYTLAAESGHGLDQKYAARARDALQDEAKLSKDEITSARQLATDWKREKSEMDRERAKAAAEKAEKEKVAKRREELAEREEKLAAEKKEKEDQRKAEEDRKAKEKAERENLKAEKEKAEAEAREAKLAAKEAEEKAKAEEQARLKAEREAAKKAEADKKAAEKAADKAKAEADKAKAAADKAEAAKADAVKSSSQKTNN